MNNTLKNLKEALFAMILVVMCSIPMTMLKADKTVPAENIEQFVDVFKRIKEQYVDKIDDEELFKAAIKGMVSGLDPHSAFLSNDDFNELKIGTTGKFGGLGIEITTEDGYVKVITPIDDTPAQRAGILAGDLIVKVGETSVKDMEIGDAVKLMRGEPGTKIQITVLRKKLDEPLVIDITRQIIVSKGIKYKIFDNIGYVRLSSFQSNSTNDLKSTIYKLKKLSDKPIDGLVLDLRNNPGGVLGAAVGITDLFLQEGKIVYTNGRTINSKLEYFATPQDILNGLPIVVMVNGGSASASEIVAGALQDSKRAKIVGTKSYGKASVQTIQELSDGSALKLTTARYYTPLGRDIHKQGIVPDVIIEYEKDKLVALPEPYEKDNQLIKAIEVLSEMKPKES
ncbi:MAG: S41 family peptidase [Gammaproteobacteria bacterium]|jgi:carboxyl-terminal processing protease|nr:S41 family peptidase [Gammaproteobacteria bacterium]MBT4462352.1 S41 family peptidase [Gammaproteobacteria bacterium]MBT4655279.1 S41 family peptidase [Gammaproteobacteria bacterium]MBT5117205.1 S41 family peptidase [Gammaproteobacteria bacterium]MBT5762094.1 S41 family peptidase [Gammaproteobacteria bacterium]